MSIRLYEDIYRNMIKSVEDFGFLGDKENPVDVSDWWGTGKKRTPVRHALKHAHANGVCVKSRYGFCKA